MADVTPIDDEPTPQHLDTTKKPVLPSSVYDILKPIVQIVLPGIGALYFAFAGIWGFPNAEQVVGSITALTVFLGLLLGLSTASYNASDAPYDGVVNVTSTPDGTQKAGFVFNQHPTEMADQKSINLKVVKQ